MCSLRVLLWTLGVILIISVHSSESRRPRPNARPPPLPLYLYPGPHPPTRKRVMNQNPPNRRPHRQSAASDHHYHSEPHYPDSDPDMDPHYPARPMRSKPPHKMYDYPPPPYPRPYPHKPKKPLYPRGPPSYPPSKKYPYYGMAHSYQKQRQPDSPPTAYKPYHSSETIPKETIATFVNRPSSNQKGTPTLSYDGYSSKPSVSYGPPYPPKPFKSYGVPAYDYDEDEEMYGSHHISTAVKHPSGGKNNSGHSYATSHFTFESSDVAVKYKNDNHKPLIPSSIPSTYPEFQMELKTPASVQGPAKRRKRPQRQEESAVQYTVSTSRPFTAHGRIKYSGGSDPTKFPGVDMTSVVTGKTKLSDLTVDLAGSKVKFQNSDTYPAVDVVQTPKSRYPSPASTKYPDTDDNNSNYDTFLKETFITDEQIHHHHQHQPQHKPDHSTSQSDSTRHQQDYTEADSSNHQPEVARHRPEGTTRTKQDGTVRQRPRPNKFRPRHRPQPTKQYEVHDQPEEREGKSEDMDFVE